jgi:hypothetical protein
LMARGGLHVSEVLKLTLGDVEEQKLILRRPKSGKDSREESWGTSRGTSKSP